MPPSTPLAITEQDRQTLIPLLTGEVEHAFNYESELARFFTPKMVNGTDTVLDRVISMAKPVRIDWTEREKSAQIGAVGTVTYKLEHSGYIRHEEKNISKLLSDVDTLKELGLEHGKAVARLYDALILLVLIKSTRMGAMTASGVSGIDSDVDLDKVIQAGGLAVFDAEGDENVVAEVTAKLSLMIMFQRARRRYNKVGTILLVSHNLYFQLLNNDKLVDKMFSDGNGHYGKGEVKVLLDTPVVPITLFQDLATNPDVLGIDAVSDLEINEVDQCCRAILFDVSAVRVLEAHKPWVNAFYVENEKLNKIDTQFMMAVGTRRQDYTAGLYIAKVKTQTENSSGSNYDADYGLADETLVIAGADINVVDTTLI